MWRSSPGRFGCGFGTAGMVKEGTDTNPFRDAKMRAPLKARSIRKESVAVAAVAGSPGETASVANE